MFDHPNTIMFIYGPSSYFTYYPIAIDRCLWALYQRPKVGVPEWPETRLFTPEDERVRREELLEDLKDWPELVKHAVSTSREVVYLKICDKKVLESEKWYSSNGRCVLLGDAAHPLTPHSGQGANQALWVSSSVLSDFRTNEKQRRCLAPRRTSPDLRASNFHFHTSIPPFLEFF
jgi:2-polyprenyl-6-methoxyphenol hydroxylase-like FAD-dependent oxidoreductase